jgi:hypothetical protein
MDVLSVLDEIGFIDGLHIEALVSTIDEEGMANLAPIGVRRIGDKLYMKIYKDTQTYTNLVSRDLALINITDNVEYYYIATFRDDEAIILLDHPLDNGLPPLRDADAYIVVKKEDFEDYNEFIIIKFKVIDIQIKKGFPRLITRCKNAIIESLIHATRIRVFLERGDIDKVTRLKHLISHYKDIINRICPSKPYGMIMDDLERMIREWEKNSD